MVPKTYRYCSQSQNFALAGFSVSPTAVSGGSPLSANSGGCSKSSTEASGSDRFHLNALHGRPCRNRMRAEALARLAKTTGRSKSPSKESTGASKKYAVFTGVSRGSSDTATMVDDSNFDNISNQEDLKFLQEERQRAAKMRAFTKIQQELASKYHDEMTTKNRSHDSAEQARTFWDEQGLYRSTTWKAAVAARDSPSDIVELTEAKPSELLLNIRTVEQMEEWLAQEHEKEEKPRRDLHNFVEMLCSKKNNTAVESDSSDNFKRKKQSFLEFGPRIQMSATKDGRVFNPHHVYKLIHEYLDSEVLCGLCRERPANITLLPSGTSGVCTVCSASLRQCPWSGEDVHSRLEKKYDSDIAPSEYNKLLNDLLQIALHEKGADQTREWVPQIFVDHREHCGKLWRPGNISSRLRASFSNQS